MVQKLMLANFVRAQQSSLACEASASNTPTNVQLIMLHTAWPHHHTTLLLRYQATASWSETIHNRYTMVIRRSMHAWQLAS
jgi:hypothetical protein